MDHKQYIDPSCTGGNIERFLVHYRADTFIRQANKGLDAPRNLEQDEKSRLVVDWDGDDCSSS